MTRTDYKHWKERLKVQGMGMCIQSPGLENLLKAFRKVLGVRLATVHLLEFPLIFLFAVSGKRQLIFCEGFHLDLFSRKSYFPLPIIILKHGTFFLLIFFLFFLFFSLHNYRACTGSNLPTLHILFSNISRHENKEKISGNNKGMKTSGT